MAGVDHDSLRPHQARRCSQSPVAAPPDRDTPRCQRHVGSPLDGRRGGAIVAADGVEKPAKGMDEGARCVPTHGCAQPQAAVPREDRRTSPTVWSDRRSR